MNEETCSIIKKVYDTVIRAGTYPVSSIKTAEAVKVVENCADGTKAEIDGAELCFDAKVA